MGSPVVVSVTVPLISWLTAVSVSRNRLTMEKRRIAIVLVIGRYVLQRVPIHSSLRSTQDTKTKSLDCQNSKLSLTNEGMSSNIHTSLIFFLIVYWQGIICKIN